MFYLLLSLYALLVSPPATNNIEVTIMGIRSEKGEIALGVFMDQASFAKEVPMRGLRFKKNKMQNGSMTVRFDLAPGIYGLSLLDDENTNQKMDYSWIGIPQEGFGFSDYYHKGFSKPTFEDFKFTISDSSPRKIEIRIRYMG